MMRFPEHAGHAELVRELAERLLLVTPHGTDRPVAEDEGRREEAPPHAGEVPVPERGAAEDDARDLGQLEPVGREILGPDEHIEGEGILDRAPDRDAPDERREGGRSGKRHVLGDGVGGSGRGFLLLLFLRGIGLRSGLRGGEPHGQTHGLDPGQGLGVAREPGGADGRCGSPLAQAPEPTRDVLDPPREPLKRRVRAQLLGLAPLDLPVEVGELALELLVLIEEPPVLLAHRGELIRHVRDPSAQRSDGVRGRVGVGGRGLGDPLHRALRR